MLLEQSLLLSLAFALNKDKIRFPFRSRSFFSKTKQKKTKKQQKKNKKKKQNNNNNNNKKK